MYTENNIIVNSNTYNTILKDITHDNEISHLIYVQKNDLEDKQILDELECFKDGIRYIPKNVVTANLDQIDMFFHYANNYVLVSSVVFFLLSILIMFNFINFSVRLRKRDIGILCALGANRKDVIKIYSCESLFISLGCFIFTSIVFIITTTILNNYIMSSYKISVSLLNMSIIQFLLILITALTTSLISSIIPIYRYSNIKPSELIRSNKIY